jgi:hypothetical protein
MTKTRLQPVTVELELEVGKTYQTKIVAGDYYRIEKIIRKPLSDKIIGLEGIYQCCPHLGLCPLDPERIIKETKIEYKEVLICECCGKDL